MKGVIATESEMIDYLLNAWNDNEYPDIPSPHEHVLYSQATRKVKAFDLAVPMGVMYDLTQQGYEVWAAGGFDQWQLQRQHKEEAVHRATLDSAKATVESARHAKQSKNAAWVAVGVSLIALALSAYPFVKSSQESEKVTTKKPQQVKASKVLPATKPPINIIKADSLRYKK